MLINSENIRAPNHLIVDKVSLKSGNRKLVNQSSALHTPQSTAFHSYFWSGNILQVKLKVKIVRYLRLKVPVDDAMVMHVADSFHKLLHDLTRFCLREPVLASDPLQQLTSPQQLQHQVSVHLHKHSYFTLLVILIITLLS